jgi:hypothetical protein
MDRNLLGLVELLLIVGIVFGFGFAQLASLRRDKRQRERMRNDMDRDERPPAP